MAPIAGIQSSCTVDLKAPLFAGISWTLSADWKPGRVERVAAWEMYVELITRIATVPLAEDCGVLREALTSLHSIFPTTREILRRSGPSVAKRKKSWWRKICKQESDLAFAEVAVFVLNAILRPFLSKWHPELESWEAQRGELASRAEHERKWDKNTEFRRELEQVRIELQKYIDCLAKAAGVDPTFVKQTTIVFNEEANL
jgi:hypothetical protein